MRRMLYRPNPILGMCIIHEMLLNILIAVVRIGFGPRIFTAMAANRSDRRRFVAESPTAAREAWTQPTSIHHNGTANRRGQRRECWCAPAFDNDLPSRDPQDCCPPAAHGRQPGCRFEHSCIRCWPAYVNARRRPQHTRVHLPPSTASSQTITTATPSAPTGPSLPTRIRRVSLPLRTPS